MGIRETFNDIRHDATQADRARIVRAMRVRAESEERKAKQQLEEKEAEDGFVDAVLIEATNEVLQAFAEAFDKAMAFYAQAFEQLEALEARITAKLHELETQTVLLTGKDGQAVYRDDQGGFYAIKDGQRRAISDEDELAPLRDEVKAIEAKGQRLRTPKDQSDFVRLTVLLSDTHTLQTDTGSAQDRAIALNDQVHDNPDHAGEAKDKIDEDIDRIGQRIKVLTSELDGLVARRESRHVNQPEDHAERVPVITSKLDSMPAAPM